MGIYFQPLALSNATPLLSVKLTLPAYECRCSYNLLTTGHLEKEEREPRASGPFGDRRGPDPGAQGRGEAPRRHVRLRGRERRRAAGQGGDQP